jgi:hypothetical protein
MDATFWTYDVPFWFRVNWAPLVAGIAAGSLTFMAARMALRRRKVEGLLPDDENLPWEDLLDLLKERYSEPDGADAIGHLSPDELCRTLLADLPRRTLRALPTKFAQEDLKGMNDRRRSRRRWLNPIAVSFFAPMREHPLHGIVINRSTGGFALLADFDFVEGTVLIVRALEAPENVPAIRVQVRHSRKAGSMWLLGCEYTQELPWNVKVWFG